MKIYGEHTRPTDGARLCTTCTAAMIVRGTRFGDDRTICAAGLGVVTFHVTECSNYNDARVVPVYRLEEIAWRMWGGRFVNPTEFWELHNHASQEKASPGSASGLRDVQTTQAVGLPEADQDSGPASAAPPRPAE